MVDSGKGLAALDELEAKARAATPGPWRVSSFFPYSRAERVWQVEGVLRWREHTNSLHCDGDQATAEFIAAANPAVILELVALVRSGVEFLDAWKAHADLVFDPLPPPGVRRAREDRLIAARRSFEALAAGRES